MKEDKEDRLIKVLKTLAPGTPFREGLENVLRARTGALIVVGDTPQVMALVDGGFKIDTEASPANLYELCKMDGALILTHDCRRIQYANAHLNPDPSGVSSETGIRHRTAERVARQTGELVVAISQRRNVISIYQGAIKYVLPDTAVILAKANQALQTLEKYKSVLEQSMVNLSALEYEDLVTVTDVASVVQRTEMVLRIAFEIRRYAAELGSEGRLVDLQLQELVGGVHEEDLLLIKDYARNSEARSPEEIRAAMASWTTDNLLDLEDVARVLGFGPGIQAMDAAVSPRGYRILKKIPRLPMLVIDNLIGSFRSFQQILNASLEELDEVEGIGGARARSIKEGLRRLREQVLLDRHV